VEKCYIDIQISICVAFFDIEYMYIDNDAYNDDLQFITKEKGIRITPITKKLNER
jgi:hypothetical protein